MLSMSSIRSSIQLNKVSAARRAYRFFSTSLVTKAIAYKSDVVLSKTEAKLYRIDDISIAPPTSSQSSTPQFSLLELLFFRIAKIHGTVCAKDVVLHQGSTRLIGMTSSEESALNLAKAWSHRNAILHIDPIWVKGLLIDVDATVQKAGTGFYTSIQEHEHALTVLPISAISEIRLTQSTHTIPNPLYITPSRDVMTEFQRVFKMQRDYLTLLYELGHTLTPRQRQDALVKVVEQTTEFFQAYLGQDNPFTMSLTQFIKLYGNSFSDIQLNRYSLTTPVLKVLLSDGDELLMQEQHFRKIVGMKEKKELLERANEENGYGGTRYSYSFD